MLQNNLHNRLLNVIKDSIGGWFVGTIDYILTKVNEGEVYSVAYVFEDVVNEGNVMIRLKASSTHSCHFTFAIGSDGKILFKTYLNSTYTDDGLEYIPFNRKTSVTTPPNTSVYIEPVVDTLGDLRGDDLAGSGTNVPSRAGATGAGDKVETILMPGDDMLIEVEDVSGANVDISFNINFYEIKE